VTFQVLKAERMRMAVFWGVAPYSLVEVYRRFRGAYCFYRHHYGLVIFILGTVRTRNLTRYVQKFELIPVPVLTEDCNVAITPVRTHSAYGAVSKHELVYTEVELLCMKQVVL
jgi:hypothetical protein